MLKKTHLDNSFAIYARLLRSVRPYWPSFSIGIIATIIASGADAGIAWVVKPLVDKGLVGREPQFLFWLPFIIVSAFLLRGVADFFSNYYIIRVGRNVVMDYRQQVFDHMLRLPARFYDRESSGQLLALLIYNVEQLAAATTDALLTILREGFLLIGLVVVMFVVSWQLSLLFMLMAPIMMFIVRKTTQRLRKLSGTVQDAVADVTHIAEESIEGYQVIRTFGGEEYERKKFDAATQTNRQREVKVALTDALGGSSVQIIASLPLAFILYLATLPALQITVGAFGAMIVAILRLLTPMRRLTKVNTTIQKGIAGAASIFNLLDEPAEKDRGTKTLKRAGGKIVYQNVAFNYIGSYRPVLHNINFMVKPGQSVALVGKSGGGKSTIIRLLPRFYDVTSGSILIDDEDIREYKLADLRNQFAIVSQHVTLFNDTVAHNIAYGRFSDASEADIIHAAKAAHAMDFIQEMPEGLQTLVGENGLLLSGGQRQRLAIARAILKNAPILILDEATSALDTESERHIQAALEELMRDRTTLVIAHRLSTIEKADLILVIADGRIVEFGSHEELLERQGHYAQLHVKQFKEEVAL